MPAISELNRYLQRTETYLVDTLLPFWIERSLDPDCGGFLTYFDRHGRPTGETTKTFLMQIRMLYTMSSAHRAGYGDGKCAELAEMGASFILDHYWDHEHEGWYWIADRQGRRPLGTRSATDIVSASTRSANTSWPRVICAGAKRQNVPTPPSVNIWPTVAAAGTTS